MGYGDYKIIILIYQHFIINIDSTFIGINIFYVFVKLKKFVVRLLVITNIQINLIT